MVFVVDEWKIPSRLKSVLCQCQGIRDFIYDSEKKLSRCKTCGKFPPHIARHCVGCGIVFLLNFDHPDECSRTPLCWDCLFDPLCSDIISGHLACGLNHQSRGKINPPRFMSTVPPVVLDPNFNFEFELS